MPAVERAVGWVGIAHLCKFNAVGVGPDQKKRAKNQSVVLGQVQNAAGRTVCTGLLAGNAYALRADAALRVLIQLAFEWRQTDARPNDNLGIQGRAQQSNSAASLSIRMERAAKPLLGKERAVAIDTGCRTLLR